MDFWSSSSSNTMDFNPIFKPLKNSIVDEYLASDAVEQHIKKKNDILEQMQRNGQRE
jgi:hypothetical protein